MDKYTEHKPNGDMVITIPISPEFASQYTYDKNGELKMHAMVDRKRQQQKQSKN